MATHMTLRLAWHNDGWNGRICEKPAENSYCVGCSSYPGEMIKEKRELDWEKQHAGQAFADLDKPAACMYSGSAFSDLPSEVEASPPEFFRDDTETARWTIPASTACIWPYEAMYNQDDIKDKYDRYDYGKRLAYADEYFKQLEKNQSLVFYYANYSNPFSDDETPRYVLVGVARLKSTSDFIYYDGCSEKTIDRYKGFVWQRNITSHYPEQGLRLPYHRYKNNPDVLEQFVVYPENNQLCKYATRHVSDDQALGLLEQVLESCRVLRDDIQDDSENWGQRIEWIQGLIAELWKSRGAYPGMPVVLKHLGLHEAIDSFKAMVTAGKEKEGFDEVVAFCAGTGEMIGDYVPLDDAERNALVRSIKLGSGEHLDFVLHYLSRCDISENQLDLILDPNRQNVGITASLNEVKDNLFILSEQYQGSSADDRIVWSMVDRGVIPSPELGVMPLCEKNSPERVRALLLETLRNNAEQTFVKASVLINQVNKRVSVHPEWKRNLVSEQYITVDKDFLDQALYIRTEDDVTYLYDRLVWEDERLVESRLGELLNAPDIDLKQPVTKIFWKQELYKAGSKLAGKAPADYQKAIDGQITACMKIIHKPLSVLTGGAGTGKSTVVSAIIKAIRKGHGGQASIAVLAPTGKATDRLRSILDSDQLQGVDAATIHSILARHGWLNPNMSFKLQGGKPINAYNTIIIDESSMIDLTLMAALFRAIDWHAIQRLILVGDPAQLPPIGVGKVFADVVVFVANNYADYQIELKENLRQLLNRVEGKGNGILELANCFINSIVKVDETPHDKAKREALIQKLHEGGDIQKDLRVEYWDDSESVAPLILNRVTEDLAGDRELVSEVNSKKGPSYIWGEALVKDVTSFQILSPLRGENYGTEVINQKAQEHKSGYWLKKGNIDGITIYDKVIQVINRPPSNPLYGYNFEQRSQAEIEVYNGELGLVNLHSYDSKEGKYKKWGFKLNRFNVKFAGKNHLSVEYGKQSIKTKKGKYIAAKPEDNLELGYAISVHKSQGSEFKRVYIVLPAMSLTSRMMELVYTGLTRANTHCTVYVEKSVETLVNAMRPEQSSLKVINSSLFDFAPVKDEFLEMDWYEAGKVHEAITGDMVRSKSEVIIANLLHERGIPFMYEKPLIAKDGTMYLPDFTVTFRGEEYYWEHVGMLDDTNYAKGWEEKKSWYDRHFPKKLVFTTEEKLSKSAAELIFTHFK